MVIKNVMPSTGMRRSREGAWIEIANMLSSALQAAGRSREGAWIEIANMLSSALQAAVVAPARERGLKSFTKADNDVETNVAPARERGLKSWRYC